jgi:hypothetical protein
MRVVGAGLPRDPLAEHLDSEVEFEPALEGGELARVLDQLDVLLAHGVDQGPGVRAELARERDQLFRAHPLQVETGDMLRKTRVAAQPAQQVFHVQDGELHAEHSLRSAAYAGVRYAESWGVGTSRTANRSMRRGRSSKASGIRKRARTDRGHLRIGKTANE